MNRNNKTFSFLLLLMMMGALSLFAENQATLTETTGKVEVFLNGGWKAAVKGMQLPLNTALSTGFNSTAKLNLGDSEVTVNPLSRLKIQELGRTADAAKTTLYLAAGKVKATVHSSSKLKHNFQFKSPIATASVRGTDFDFTPTELTVNEGSVSFSNHYGQTQLIIKGESVVADPNSGAQNVKPTQFGQAAAHPTSDPTAAYEPEDSDKAPTSPKATTGQVHFSVSYE